MDYSFVAASLIACSGFFPENNLSIPISDKSGLNQEQYEKVISKVENIYSDVIKDYGGNLMINRKWESPVVNAGTLRTNDNSWQINLYGGMARHEEMTEDAFALVICHELGHHIGGAPKKIISGKRHWSSTEGQSDYWATLKCLRRVFESEDNDEIVSQTAVPQVVNDECQTTLCKRTSLASLAISKINAQIRGIGDPDFSTPDLTRVMLTDDQHPVAQCRLDTLFQGALCSLDWKKTVSQYYEGPGTCHPKEGYEKGIRPLCWYRSTRE